MTQVAALSISIALAVSGCWRGEPTAAEPQPVTAAPVAVEPAATKKPAETKQPARRFPRDLPAECVEYVAAVAELAKCSKLPQETRDALRESVEQTAAAWADVPAEGKAALASACQHAADAVRQSAAGCQSP